MPSSSSPDQDPTRASAGSARAGRALLVQRWAPAVVLFVGGALVGSAGALGLIRATGAVAPTSVPLAVWSIVVPGVLALAATAIRPSIGAAVAGGAGVLAAARLLTDPFLIGQPAQVARPEFYFPSATGVHVAEVSVPASLLLMLGDLVLIGAGILGLRAVDAAVRGRIADSSRSTPGALAGQQAAPVPGVPAEGQSPVAPLNVRMLTVGMLGVALAVGLSVGSPYTGGYLLDFYTLPSDVGSTLGPFALALLSAAMVVRAAGFPRSIATAVLVGSAVMTLVPIVTSLLAVNGGARTSLSGAPLFTPLALLLMVSAGLLSSVRFSREDGSASVDEGQPGSTGSGIHASPANGSSTPGSQRAAIGRSGSQRAATPRTTDERTAAGGPAGRRSPTSARTGAARAKAPAAPAAAHYGALSSEPWAMIGTAAIGLAGVLAILAPRFGMLHVNGAVPTADQLALVRIGPVVGQTVSSVMGVPAVVAGIVLLAAALSTVALRVAGRTTVAATPQIIGVLAVLLPLIALAAPLSALATLSTGQSQATTAIADNPPDGFRVDTWTSGAGLFTLIAALALSLAGAVCSIVALSRQGQERTSAPDDDATDAARTKRSGLAAGLVLLAVLACSVPTWRLPGDAASTVLSGDAAWTCWLIVVGVLAAAVVVAVAGTPAFVLGAAIAGALLVAARLVVPGGVTGTAGFSRPFGWYLGLLCAVAMLALGILALIWTRAVADVVIDSSGAETLSGTAAMGSAPHVDNRSKPIRGR